jgi:hypothetical protein
LITDGKSNISFDSFAKLGKGKIEAGKKVPKSKKPHEIRFLKTLISCGFSIS